MALDWDSIDVDGAIEQAADKTDEKLASKISSVSSLTDQDIMELFPEPADVKRLQELMRIVKSAEDRHAKINRIVNNAEEFSGIVLSLLSKLA